MKKRLLIACTMQLDIIRYIMKEYKIELPVIWLDRTLHNCPCKLHMCIQNVICEHQDVDEILLSYGLCGNATLGLFSENTKLIMPAFDDCICQYLYKKIDCKQRHVVPEKGCFYLTREWTIDAQGIVQQCEDIYAKYGKDNGQVIIDEIYADYHTLVLLKTEAYDVDKICGYVDKAMKYTGMRVKMQNANTEILENLLKGDYSRMMVKLHPGEIMQGFKNVF